MLIVINYFNNLYIKGISTKNVLILFLLLSLHFTSLLHALKSTAVPFYFFLLFLYIAGRRAEEATTKDLWK